MEPRQISGIKDGDRDGMSIDIHFPFRFETARGRRWKMDIAIGRNGYGRADPDHEEIVEPAGRAYFSDGGAAMVFLGALRGAGGSGAELAIVIPSSKKLRNRGAVPNRFPGPRWPILGRTVPRRAF